MANAGVRSVLIVGAGSIGARRAEIAAQNPGSRIVGACDPIAERAEALCQRHGGTAFGDAREAVASLQPEIVVVSTPHRELAPIASEALRAGAAVLMEKPFGRDVAEARSLIATAEATQGLLRVGFNHRYEPAIARAHERIAAGAIGEVQFVRCVYGHGGRPGYEREWRADRELAGGGELLDQGVHVIDLLCGLLGQPQRVHAELATLSWDMPVEDNAFALLRYPRGAVASVHVSWTQWQNRFEWQVYGERGAIEVHGLGGHYGPPTLIEMRRRPGTAPERVETRFPGGIESWQREWQHFLDALSAGGASDLGRERMVMEVIDALYRSAADAR